MSARSSPFLIPVVVRSRNTVAHFSDLPNTQSEERERAIKNDGSIGAPKARKPGEVRTVPLLAFTVMNAWNKLSKFTEDMGLIFPSDYKHRKPLATAISSSNSVTPMRTLGLELAIVTPRSFSDIRI